MYVSDVGLISPWDLYDVYAITVYIISCDVLAYLSV